MQTVEASPRSFSSAWPALPFDAWHDTRDTLHRWTQIVGKIQLGLTPTVNHWWNVPLRVTSRGLATSIMPYGDRWLEMEFDFIADALRIRVDDGSDRAVALAPRSVADFYRDTMATLHDLGIDVHIWPVPVEVFDDPIRFDRDELHRAYDKASVMRFWRIVARTTEVLETFRARFLGKASPVQFFWGTFDLAAGRFSGRRAPDQPVSRIEREAYSHEVIGAGWWPGDSRLPHPAFYTYAVPEPAGYADARVPLATYLPALHGFYLDHDDLRATANPDRTLLDFYQDAYAAAADLGRWDRAALERGT